MLISADYPFLNILWTMILFFAWVAWIWVLIVIVADLFRRHDASGWVKALWIVVLIVFPFLGVLGYLIVNGKGMAERTAQHAQANQAQLTEYVQSIARSGDGGGAATELEKAKALPDGGAITQEEYEALKAKILA